MRDQLRDAFISASGWNGCALQPLSGDASFRRYFRLTDQRGQTALLMDSPPDREDQASYLQVAEGLLALHLSAPKIYETDDENGFAIIEDFGDLTYSRLIAQGEDAGHLYRLAVDVLIELQQRAVVQDFQRPPYNTDRLLQEALLLPDWYLPALSGRPTSNQAREAYRHAWQAVFDDMPAYTPTLVLRDYHVDNLMIIEDREGLQRCGLLDFQDALTGHPAYDLASLLEDARRDVDATLAAEMLDRYRQSSLATDPGFDTWYEVLAAQRHAKVAGIFVRLCVRDGKPVYLPHIPRVMKLLESHLDHPALSPVKAWFEKNLPNILQTLPAL